MKKYFTATIFGLFIFASCGLMAAGLYLPSSVGIFTQTGRVNVTAVATSASAVLPTHSGSTPQATTAVVQNFGSETVYIAFSPASNVTATTTGSYPIRASQSAVLGLGNARYAAVIAASGPAATTISTGY